MRFYSEGSGSLPGTLVAERLAQGYSGEEANLDIDLAAAVALGAGTYWVSVQANLDFNPNGQWGWVTRSVQSGVGRPSGTRATGSARAARAGGGAPTAVSTRPRPTRSSGFAA